MEIQIKKVDLRIMKADNDKVLTNGETYSSVGGHVYLGTNDSPENWYEISKEAYEDILKEKELI